MFLLFLFDILLVLKLNKELNVNYCGEKINTKEILGIYASGCKDVSTLGLEYERIPVTQDYRSVPYYGDWGIAEFLADFATEDNWDYILDNTNIIGLKKLHDTITIEPGCQFEISLAPKKFIKDIKHEVDKLNTALKNTLELYEIKLLNYGVTPVSTYKYIPLNPKRRYKTMAKYLGGILSDVMMRETAGVQVCIDYSSEEDATRKFNTANKLSPFMTAMFANSQIRGGVNTDYKTFRALAWLNTDNERCGFGTKFKNENLFEDYINFVLNTPMIFIQRGSDIIEINGQINFKEFIKNGYQNYYPTLDDYKLQANLVFPDVRLNSFIEIRNHDCVPEEYLYSLLAIYKGIMYDRDALEAINETLQIFDYEEICELRYRVPREGLKTKLGHYKLLDISKEIIETAYYSLKIKCEQEEEFILPIKELIFKGLTPGDITTPLILKALKI